MLAIQSKNLKLKKICEGSLEVSDEAFLHARGFVDVMFEDKSLEDPRTYFSKGENQQQLLEICTRFDDEFSEVHQAISLIDESMKHALGEPEWEKLSKMNPQELQECIESSLSAESIWKSLTWKKTSTDMEIANSKGYLKTCLEKADSELLRKFVRAITSNNSLPVAHKIKVELVRRSSESFPIAHTCFSSIELSSQYISQENFNERLAYLVGQADEGFLQELKPRGGHSDSPRYTLCIYASLTI